MEGLAWGAGIFLVLFGPLLLVFPVWAIYAVLKRIALSDQLGVALRFARRTHLALAVAVVAAVVVATYLPGRLAWGELCDRLAEPRILERVHADGFFLDDSTADSFGMRYIGEEHFAWFETWDYGNRKRYVRYRVADSKTVREPVSELQARYAVTSTVDKRSDDISVYRIAVTERASGRLLGEAHSITFRGGPLGLILGIYASGTCPSPITQNGSRQFQGYYHFAREVLGGGA